MSTEEHKALIRRYYDELNRKNFAVYDELIAPEVTYEGVPVGREGLPQISTMLRTAFPDLRITAEELVAEGDLVATYFTWGGTH
jgi:predicted ester cyclase